MKNIFLLLFLIVNINATCINLMTKVGYDDSTIKVKYCDDDKYYFEIPNIRVPYLEAILDKNEFTLLIKKLKEVIIQSSKANENNIDFETTSIIKENIFTIRYYSSSSMLVIDIKRDYKSEPFALIGKEKISDFTFELEKRLNDSKNILSKLK